MTDETKAELVRKVVRLEAENSRLRAELYRKNTSWVKRLWRKPYRIAELTLNTGGR